MTSPEEHTNERPRQVDPPARRRWTRLVWGAALVGSAAFAVWQGVVFLQSPPASPVRPTLDTGAQNAPEPVDPISAEMLQRDPSELAGLRAVSTDPPASPPPSVKLLWSLGRPALRKGYVELLWRYESQAPAASLADGFDRALRDRGFQAISRSSTDGARRLIFRQGDRTVHVVLRPAVRKPMIHVVVIETRPGGADDLDPSGKERVDG